MKELVYAQDEKEIKKYNYATMKTKGKMLKGKTQKNLIITNKRIINETLNERNVVRNEIPISSVDFIYSDFRTQNNALIRAILLTIVGILLAIFLPVYVGLAVCAIGIIYLVICILSGKESVSLVFSGCKDKHNILSVGSSSLSAGKNIIRKTKIRVDRDIASEMVREIGSILLEIRSGVKQ